MNNNFNLTNPKSFILYDKNIYIYGLFILIPRYIKTCQLLSILYKYLHFLRDIDNCLK